MCSNTATLERSEYHSTMIKTRDVIHLALIAVLFVLTGCNITAPRARMGTLPTPPPGPRFENPNNLGKHSYHFNPLEKNGIVKL